MPFAHRRLVFLRPVSIFLRPAYTFLLPALHTPPSLLLLQAQAVTKLGRMDGLSFTSMNPSAFLETCLLKMFAHDTAKHLPFLQAPAASKLGQMGCTLAAWAVWISGSKAS